MTVPESAAAVFERVRAGRRRCEWCGVFVRADAEPTAWKVRVGYNSKVQQSPRSPWNFWSRLLCPSCAQAVPSGSWRLVTLAEVQRRHATGWDPTAPRRNYGLTEESA